MTRPCLLLLAALAGCSRPSSPPGPSATTTTAAAATSTAPAPQASAPAPAASPSGSAAPAAPTAGTDTIDTAKGPLGLRPLRHASTLFTFGGKTIYLDPSTEVSLAGLPKADFIFLSDIHSDHLDPAALAALRQERTVVVGPPAVADKVPGLVALKNGEKRSFEGIDVEAIPMYNLKRGPGPGKLFHDKGRGNGYVFTFGGKRVYASGDTECTDEMRALKQIDVALVCMNLPYTMPPDEAAACVKAFKPKVVYPYHYRGSNLDEFENPLKGEPIEVRRRAWY